MSPFPYTPPKQQQLMKKNIAFMKIISTQLNPTLTAVMKEDTIKKQT